MAKRAFIVTHPRLYMEVSLAGEDKKFQRVPVGTELTLDEEKVSERLIEKKHLVAADKKKTGTA